MTFQHFTRTQAGLRRLRAARISRAFDLAMHVVAELAAPFDRTSPRTARLDFIEPALAGLCVFATSFSWWFPAAPQAPIEPALAGLLMWL